MDIDFVQNSHIKNTKGTYIAYLKCKILKIIEDKILSLTKGFPKTLFLKPLSIYITNK